MNLDSIFNRTAWAIGLAVLAVYLIWRQFRKRNELEQHALEQGLLGEIGEGVATVENLALDMYPLAEIGLQPMAGIETDPFNPTGIASQPHNLQLAPSTPSGDNPDYAPQLLKMRRDAFLFGF